MLGTYLIIAAVAYLLGSVPFGYILVRVFRGEDVRATGSGNIGATNVARKAPGLGLATLILDAAKGYVAVEVATILASRAPDQQWFNGSYFQVRALAALLAIVGHVLPVWLGFRGGKGVATGVGAFAALAPKSVLIAVGMFAAVVAASRYVSLGSITAAIAFPVLAYMLRPNQPWEVFAAMAAASLVIVAKHHENIRRLLAGTEHKFELKRSKA